MPRKRPTLYCEGGTEIVLPFRWAICGTCGGEGQHSRHLGAITQDEMDELGPDFLEAYMAGEYDTVCEACDGSGKVTVADPSRMTPVQRRAWAHQEREDAEYEALCRSERERGC